MTANVASTVSRMSRSPLLDAVMTYVLTTCMVTAVGWANAALGQNAKETFTNEVGMEFVRIPAGTFLMGSPDSDPDARDFAKPRHEVTISEPFWLGRYEVTQAQWEAVMGENPYVRERSNPYYELRGTTHRSSSPG